MNPFSASSYNQETEPPCALLDVPHKEYRRWPALSASMCRAPSMKHMLHNMSKPTGCDLMDTSPGRSDMNVGSAVHAYLLEPDGAQERFPVWEEGGVRTKKGKWGQWAEEQSRNSAVEALMRPKDMDRVNAIVEAVNSHELARKILAHVTMRELSISWRFEDVPCKSRIDGIAFPPNKNVADLIDIKTTNSLEDRSFEQQMVGGYGEQCGAYWEAYRREGHIKLGWRPPRNFYFICVENNPPYDVVCRKIPSDDIDIGRARFREVERRFKQCCDTGVWPGMGEKMQSVGYPDYFRNQNANLDDSPDQDEELYRSEIDPEDMPYNMVGETEA